MTENGKAPLMTSAEVAARLSVSRATVVDYARRGLIQSVRIGQQTRFEPEAVEEFIKIRRVAATPPKRGV
jgi:excisionase family DNA binding protein